MIAVGARLTLDVEKPAAGGRMLARHGGQVVLVSGTIPGERVVARVERTGKGVVFAAAVEIVTASPDRRKGAEDWRCGGNVFSHIAYPRQREIKAQIIQDAFGRIGRMPLGSPPDVLASPEEGYRMRARLHVHGSRIGFFREGTHQLCDAATTGQLLPSTVDWIRGAEALLGGREREGHRVAVDALEVAEDVAGAQRAVHLELHEKADADSYAILGNGLAGLSAQAADARQPTTLAGTPFITDVIRVREGADAPALTLRRDVRAFFQGNRFLLEPLVQRVVSLAGPGPAVDLYAGVGLFGLSLAAAGAPDVTLVEGDPISGADLSRNAEPFGRRANVRRESVELFLAASLKHARVAPGTTFLVDPPRTGMTREALGGIINHEPPRIIYVSCDVATLARDARTLVDAGYELAELTGIDLFPNTAHVETIAVFSR